MAEIESLATAEAFPKHLQRHRTDRLIMLSDGIFAIATTLAALEIRLPANAASLGALLHQSATSLIAYLLSFMFSAVFWVASRELFARVARTDNILTLLTLGNLCMIAVIPAAVHVFYTPGGLAVGFKFYGLVMCICGAFNSAMWIYAAARPGVMRADVSAKERWVRALSTVFMPIIFLVSLFLDKSQIAWVMIPFGLWIFVMRRIVIPRFGPKPVENAA